MPFFEAPVVNKFYENAISDIKIDHQSWFTMKSENINHWNSGTKEKRSELLKILWNCWNWKCCLIARNLLKANQISKPQSFSVNLAFRICCCCCCCTLPICCHDRDRKRSCKFSARFQIAFVFIDAIRLVC